MYVDGLSLCSNSQHPLYIHVLFFRGWKCSRCDLKENLWLNLTDGTILCGRKYFDGWYLHENTFSLKMDVEDITWLHGDTKFLFEC